MLRPGDRAPTAVVAPVSGLPVDLGTGPLVVLFLRPLAGGMARVAIASVQAAMAQFDARAVRVVAITRGDLTMARDYVPRHHVLFPVVIDPDGALFDTWGVPRDLAFRQSLRGLRPSALRTVGHALRAGRPTFDNQLPAEFAVGADGRIRHTRLGPTVFAQPDIDPLITAALRADCAP